MDALKRFTAGMLRGTRWLLLALTSIAAATLRGIRWLLLALASGTVWLADAAEEAAERLRP